MKREKNNEIITEGEKKKRSFWDTMIGMLISFILIFITACLFSVFPALILRIFIALNKSDGRFLLLFSVYFCAGCQLIVTILYCIIFKSERPLLKVWSPKNSRNSIKWIAAGLAIGVFLNGICIMSAFLNKNIQFETADKNPVLFAVMFIAVAGQSSSEEFMCRGIIFFKLKKSYNAAVAIIVNSVFFGVLHIFNSGVTVLAVLNIILYGVFSSLIMYYTDSMWCCCAIHTAWNFTQNIVFGLPNSGLESTYSILSLKGEPSSDLFFYNIDFGVEGTGLVCVVLIAAVILLIMAGRKIGVKEKYAIWSET